MRAIQCSRFGGPEVLTLVDLPDPVATAGTLLVEVSAAGVNYADTHKIDGSSSGSVKLPFIPGGEVVGHSADGRRVLAATVDGGGGYAERALVPSARAVTVPPEVTDGEALALLVQGLTAWHVLRSSARLREGESVVVNAAAGGVGSLAVQLARHFGAGRVIAAASTEAKRDFALSLGADAAVDSAAEGYSDRIQAANDGRAVDVVLDSTGGAVFTAALDALAGFGRLVTYGNAARQGRPLVDPVELASRNAAVIGFWLRPAWAMPGMFHEPLTELLRLTADGDLRPVVGGEYPLEGAAQAFEDLVGRRSSGKLVLRP